MQCDSRRLGRSIVGLLLFLGLATPSLGDSPTTHPTTRPMPGVPSPQRQAELTQLVHDIFKSDYAKHAPAERKALAAKLLQQARETRDDADARYVLLHESRQLALAAEDGAIALQATDELAGGYQLDAVQLRLVTLTALAPATGDIPAATRFVRHGLSAVDEAVVADDYDSADRLLQLAENAAARVKKVELAAQVQAIGKDLAALRRQHEQYTRAQVTLASDANNAEARLLVGRVRCLVKGDWEGGLPLLAESSDPVFRNLARRDLQALRDGPISDGAVHNALANDWWELAQAQDHLAKARLEARAGYWYQRALPQLSGLSRSVAVSRLQRGGPDRLVLAKLTPGLVAEVFAGDAFGRKLVVRLDPQIDFDWGNNGPGSGLPKDDFSLRWTGWIKIPASGTYTFVLHANSGARLFIDGQLLLESERIYRSKVGLRHAADLSEGAHAIRLEYWDTTGLASVSLQWLAPGASAPVPIPPEALAHEHTPALEAEMARYRE